MATDDLSREFESEKAKNFYEKLRKKITDYMDEKVGEDQPYADYLLLAPDLFYLLYKLSTDSRVPGRYRLELVGAIAYFIMPIDLIPEAFVGPAGYADGIILACYVLNNLLNDVDGEAVRGHWPGEKDILKQIQQVLDVADEWVGEQRFNEIKKWLDKFLT